VFLHSSEDSDDDCAGARDIETTGRLGGQEEAELGEKSVKWDPVLERHQSPPPLDSATAIFKTTAATPEVSGFYVGVLLVLLLNRISCQPLEN